MRKKRLKQLRDITDTAETELENCPVEQTDARLADYIKAKEIYNKYAKNK